VDRSDGSRSPAIEGYCSKQRVVAGETIEIMVSTDPLWLEHPARQTNSVLAVTSDRFWLSTVCSATVWT